MSLPFVWTNNFKTQDYIFVIDNLCRNSILILIFFNIFLILFGFIYRVGMMKMEYKKKFSFSKFIQNIPNCKHSHKIPKNIWEPFRHVFD